MRDADGRRTADRDQGASPNHQPTTTQDFWKRADAGSGGRTESSGHNGGSPMQGHNTGLRGLVLRSGFPPAAEFSPRAVGPPSCGTPPLLGAKEYSPRVSSVYQVSP